MVFAHFYWALSKFQQVETATGPTRVLVAVELDVLAPVAVAEAVAVGVCFFVGSESWWKNPKTYPPWN